MAKNRGAFLCHINEGKLSIGFGRAQVIEGLDWVREHYVAPAVVVMALGGEPQYALDMAVRALVSAGVPVVVAAGNEDSDACAKSPARCSVSFKPQILDSPELESLAFLKESAKSPM